MSATMTAPEVGLQASGAKAGRGLRWQDAEDSGRRRRAEQHDRRVRAACLARRLQIVADTVGGFASGRLRVRLPGTAERRPAAAVVAGEPPVDGVVGDPPLLVVEFAPAAPGAWLAAGVEAVWVLGPAGLTLHTCEGTWGLGPDDHVAVPSTDQVRLPVASLLA